MRVAWHSAGTFNASDGTGGANGATMRFEPEASDGANAGLHIVHDMLHPVKANFPTVSYSDIWAAAGCVAVESLGGPEVPFNLGRVDSDGAGVPENGRLPDAAQVGENVEPPYPYPKSSPLFLSDSNTLY
jgi:catalase (peroxidase I)